MELTSKKKVFLPVARHTLSWQRYHQSLILSRLWVLQDPKHVQCCPLATQLQQKIQGDKVWPREDGSNELVINLHCKCYTYIHSVTYFKVIKNNRHPFKAFLGFKFHVKN